MRAALRPFVGRQMDSGLYRNVLSIAADSESHCPELFANPKDDREAFLEEVLLVSS